MATRVKTVMVRGLMALMILAAITPVAKAVWDNEAFESESYYSYGGNKDGTFSLTYLGPGWGVSGDNCDWNDSVFRINVNRSYAGSDWKMYSSNSRYQRTPSGRPIYGFQLGGLNAHLCVGASE